MMASSSSMRTSDGVTAASAPFSRMKECGWEKQETCYVALLKLLGNIVAHPGEAKYRHLRTSNLVLKEKVFDVPGAKDLLLALGFEEKDDELELPQSVGATAVARVRD